MDRRAEVTPSGRVFRYRPWAAPRDSLGGRGGESDLHGPGVWVSVLSCLLRPLLPLDPRRPGCSLGLGEHFLPQELAGN